MKHRDNEAFQLLPLLVTTAAVTAAVGMTFVSRSATATLAMRACATFTRIARTLCSLLAAGTRSGFWCYRRSGRTGRETNYTRES